MVSVWWGTGRERGTYLLNDVVVIRVHRGPQESEQRLAAAHLGGQQVDVLVPVGDVPQDVQRLLLYSWVVVHEQAVVPQSALGD